MSKKKRSSRRDARSPPRWTGLEALDSTRRLNARCFELLAEAAKTEDARFTCNGVFGFQELWERVDTQVCERAGACPVLLLNLHFDAPERWSRMLDGALRWPGKSAPVFPVASAVPVLREILTEARTVARSEPGTAQFLFGMAPAVGTAVAALSAAEIDRIAAERVRELRPRWESSPTFWKRLLEMAVNNDVGEFAKIHVHCIQLLGTDLVARCG